MIKSSVFKKVILTVLVLATVCVFSAGVCFAEDDDPENFYCISEDKGFGMVYTFVHKKNGRTIDRFVIGPCTPEQEARIEWYFQNDPEGPLLGRLPEILDKYLQECNNANGANQNEH